MKVNDVDVLYWSHRKVVDEITRSGNIIRLTVGRMPKVRRRKDTDGDEKI